MIKLIHNEEKIKLTWIRKTIPDKSCRTHDTEDDTEKYNLNKRILNSWLIDLQEVYRYDCEDD